MAFLLANCGSPSGSAPFVDRVWKWRSSQFNNGATQNVTDPNQYTVQFMPDGQLQVKADCNTGGGSYTVNGSSLKIQPLRLTLIACPPGSLGDVFVQQLQTVTSYLMSGSELVLNIQDNSGRMIFTSETVVPSPTAVVVTAPPATAAVPTATLLNSPVPQTATPAKTQPPACPGPPQIEFFRAEPATIHRGENSVLRWGKVLAATQVAIDQGVGGVATPGSAIVAPQATTTYIMTAIGCGGTVQVSAQVVVLEPTAVPPTAVPPTAVPPTAVPPTAVPPTAVPPTQEPGADLIGVNWRWTGLVVPTGAQTNPPDPAKYTLLFQPGGALSVQADCNTATGTYTLNGSALTIQLGAMTQVACEPGSLSGEYLALLARAASYQVQGSTLTLVLNQDNGTMTFTK